MLEFFATAKKLLTVRNTGLLRCVNINKGMCTISNEALSYIVFKEELSHISANVDAAKLHSAYLATDNSPNVRLTDSYLMIEKGSFKARLALVKEEYPIVPLKGKSTVLNTAQFVNLKTLVPFISTDESRKWACSVLFRDGYAYATNNIVAARVPVDIPRNFALPGNALAELLRATTDVSGVTMTENLVRFDFVNGMSLQSRLMAAEWPEIENIISNNKCDAPPIPAGMLKCVMDLESLCSNELLKRIYLSDKGLHTEEGVSYAEYTQFNLPKSVFHSIPLSNVLRVATHCNFAGYPNPCYFKGNNIDGVLVGLR